MRTFLANTGIAYVCFKKYKNKAALYFLLLIPFFVFEDTYNYHKHHDAVFSFLNVILSVVLFGICVFSMYIGIMRINMIVRKVEIDGSQIIFETFDASMLFNLVKKESQSMSAKSEQMKFVLSTVKYGMDKKYTGDIYLLSYANEDYLVPEKFFEGFPEMKAAFESNNQ